MQTPQITNQPTTAELEAQGKRLIYVTVKKDGTRFVQSRGPRSFDYRDESGPFTTYEEADAARTKLSTDTGWPIVVAPNLGMLVGR